MRTLTGGTFDILHFGHVLHLRKCAELAGGMENVFVMLVGDRWAKERKGELRTILTWEERKEMIMALGVKPINIYFVGSPEDVLFVVEDVKPEIYIYEYSANPTAHDLVLKKIKNVKFLNLGKDPVNPYGTSTTKIIERIYAFGNNGNK